MRRNEAQQQRQNPVKASNGSYLRSPFDISQRFSDLAARQVEQGGTRRHLLATGARSEDDRDGLEKTDTTMRPWSRAGVGASRLSVKDRNMQRTQAEKIYGDDEQLYTKAGDANVVDEATAGAEKAKANKKKKTDKLKPTSSTGASGEEEAELDRALAEGHAGGASASSTSTSNGMKRQFATDMRDSEAMQKMVPSHIRRQRRDGAQRHGNRGDDVDNDDDDEASLRPQPRTEAGHQQPPVPPPQRFIAPRLRVSNVVAVERPEGDDDDDDGAPEEVAVGVGHKRGREESGVASVPTRGPSGAPRNRLQQLQAMRDSALMGGRKRR